MTMIRRKCKTDDDENAFEFKLVELVMIGGSHGRRRQPKVPISPHQFSWLDIRGAV